MSDFIGIYGGAFDPPHNSHINTAKQLIKERGYSKLILLPSHNPPHKLISASDVDRLNMLKMIENDKIILCDMEIKRRDIGYTVDYLPDIISVFGDNIEYIIGGDSFLNFSSWHKPLEILKLTKILVVPRDGDRNALLNKLAEYENVDKKGITIANYMPDSMSSSDIRTNLRLHIDVKDKLPASIFDYIKKHNLYNEYSEMVEKLKNNISEDRFAHTIRVVKLATSYCTKLKMDYNKVFLAALLHDCARSRQDMKDIVESNGLPSDCLLSPVAHAFCGKVVANKDYGVEDYEVLDAIYFHTTARPNMTRLDKLIYCADMLEEGRCFKDVQQLREIFDNDLDEGFRQCLKNTVEYLISNNVDEIYPLTMDAYHYYFD